MTVGLHGGCWGGLESDSTRTPTGDSWNSSWFPGFGGSTPICGRTTPPPAEPAPGPNEQVGGVDRSTEIHFASHPPKAETPERPHESAGESKNHPASTWRLFQAMEELNAGWHRIEGQVRVHLQPEVPARWRDGRSAERRMKN